MNKMEQENKPEKHEIPDKPKASVKPAKQEKSEKKPKAASTGNQGEIAVILIRNTVRASGQICDTLKMLNLPTKYSCAVFSKTGCLMGMLNKVKDYVTYGEADTETIKLLEEKRGKKNVQGKKGKEAKPKRTFNLHPPRGGFERKGIKHSFAQGGALGYRGAKINELIKKML